MTPENRRPSASPEPRLPEMAAAALAVLEHPPKGFFLVVEGSQVDFANHGNDPAWQRAELLAFDEAVGTVLDWIAENPGRKAETLVIVAPDHETGGYAVTGPVDRGFYRLIAGAREVLDRSYRPPRHTVGAAVIIHVDGKTVKARALDLLPGAYIGGFDNG